MALKEMVLKIQDTLEGVDEDDVSTFEKVWIGEPQKIPLASKSIAIIDIAENTDYHFTTCPSCYTYTTMVYITIYVKGQVEDARQRNYEITDLALTALASDVTFSGTCDDSTVSRVIFGELIGDEGTSLLSTSRIFLETNHSHT